MTFTTPKSLALLALTSGLASLASAQSTSGSGTTTRYWDCCKPSCAWSGKASVSAPVTACSISDSPLTDTNAANGCTGGSAYTCSDQSPWAYNSTLAFGFAAVSIAGGSESSWCCACYKLTFTSTAIAGKTLIVQATNTGADLGSNQFDLAMPGGGVGIYNGCTDEWGAPSGGWGAQYGGISSDTCSTFPTALQPGCDFRFGDFFEGADNPTVDWETITCPSELTAKTGCTRDGDTPVPYASGSGSAASSTVAASSAASSSTAAASSVAASSVASSAAASSVSSSSAVASAASIASSSAASSAAAVSSASSSSSSAIAVAVSSSASSASSAATSSAAAPSSTADDANCHVEYKYVYDL